VHPMRVRKERGSGSRGRERGTVFWSGGPNGRSVRGEFANWDSGEPNDLRGEDYAQTNFGSGWNDLGSDQEKGYVVEYGGQEDDAKVTATRTVAINEGVPVVEPVETGVAGDNIRVEVTAFDPETGERGGVPIEVVDAGGLSGLPSGTVMTNSDGTAVFEFTEEDAGVYSFTVANGDFPALTAAGSVTVVAAAIDATGSGGESGAITTVSAPSAGAGASGTIAVEGADRFGNPVAGANLSVADNGSLGGLPDGTQVSTDASGIAEFSFTETTAGTYDVVVTDENGSVTQTVTVTVTSHPEGVSGGDGGSVSVSGPGDTSAGQQQSFAVTARDVYGNLVSGEDVSATAPAGVSLADETVTTDTSGVAKFSITGETVGTYEIDFTDASGTFSDTASLSVTPDSLGLIASGSSVTAVTPPEAAAGADGEIALELADAFGNLLAGEEVVIADTGGLGGLTQGSATTANDSGVATFSFSETTAGTYTIELAADYDPDTYIGAQDARGR
jgi:Bacterial Ig-like domain (group 1).